MKKVSFIAVIHFLTGATITVNAEGKIEVNGGELSFQSIGNKFALSRMSFAITEELRNLQKNIFTTITGRIANLFHMNRELCSATRSSGYKSAKVADKLFNLHLTINIDGVEQTYSLLEIMLGKDSLATAGNIYAEIVKSLTGEGDVFDTRTIRTENLEILQALLAPFGVKPEDCKHERTDILVGTITDQVKTVNSYRREKLRNFSLVSGVSEMKNLTKKLKEQNALLEGKSPIPAEEKKAIEAAKVEVKADTEVEAKVEVSAE